MAQEKHDTVLPPATAGALWGTWVWRLILTGISGYGSWLMLADARTWTDFVESILYFTQLSTVAVFVVNLCAVIRPLVVRGSNRHRLEGNHGWFRGAATSMTMLTGIVYATLLGAQYPDLAGKIAHIVCPILMTLDWFFAGRNQTRLPWFVPITWLSILAPYLWLYAWDAHYFGRPMYDFLDPDSGDWWMWVAIMVGAYLVLCYVALFIARFLRRARA
ncbi:hypothetical protein VR010_06140 [Actinomycetaceae bacterium L2_0104]